METRDDRRRWTSREKGQFDDRGKPVIRRFHWVVASEVPRQLYILLGICPAQACCTVYRSWKGTRGDENKAYILRRCPDRSCDHELKSSPPPDPHPQRLSGTYVSAQILVGNVLCASISLTTDFRFYGAMHCERDGRLDC